MTPFLGPTPCLGVHTGAVWEMKSIPCSVWERGVNGTDQEQCAVWAMTQVNSAAWPLEPSSFNARRGESGIRDPRIRDDLCPHHEPVVLQGPSLCTKSSSQTHVPQPCPRNTPCFPSWEICLLSRLPIQSKSIVLPKMPFPPELPTQLQVPTIWALM